MLAKTHLRSDTVEVKDCPFTKQEIEQFNEQHDRKYGWSINYPNVYVNPFRLPETTIGRNWVMK